MNFLIKTLEENKKFQELTKQISKTGPIAISGLVDVEKLHVLAGIFNETKRPMVLVTYNEIQARKLYQDLKKLIKQTYFFPKKEITSYDYVAQSKEIEYKRIDVLNKMYLAKQQKEPIIIVTTIEAVMQKMIAKDTLYQNVIDFKVGKTYLLDGIKEKLVGLGYERSDLIENKGQFSIRGGIVDVGLSEKIGVRIEFWGDEVDSIRFFQISSQRSTEMLKEITIFPAHELIVQDLSEAVKNIQEKYPEEIEDIELIKNGDYISKINKYFNEFYENQASFLDYMSDEYLLLLDEKSKINQRKTNIIEDNNKLIASLVEKEKFVPEAIENISKFEYNFEEKQIIYLEQNDSIKNIQKYYFETREINFHNLQLDLLLADIVTYQKNKKKVVLLAGNEISAKKLCDILKENQINYKYEREAENVKPGEIIVTIGGFSSGFENYDLNLIVISLQNNFEEPVKRKKKLSSTFKDSEKIVFADLKPGDIVVHQTHGIGQFIGVNTITADGVTKDYIKIKYRNDDILYVPTNSLDSVRKYIGGGDNSSPRLNKLGGKEWSATTSKVKKNLEEVAKDLIELYAKRQKIKGFSFSPDTPWRKQYEVSFPYTETDADAFIKYASEQVEQNEYCIEANHEAIGNIGFVRGTDVERFNAEVGYWISETYWNKGLATAALERAIEHYFQHTDVIRLYATVYEHNAASMRVLEKAGFQKAGIHRKACFKNGQFIDAHYYELLKNKS